MEKSYIEQLGYGYMYHYNSYTGTFACMTRDAQDQYFNGLPTSRFNTANEEGLITRSEKSFEDAAKEMLTLVNVSV